MKAMSFNEKLAMYANLLVTRGMNVQPGQFVQIGFEGSEAEALMLHVVDSAYEHGARHVNVIYNHPRIKYAQLTKGPADERFFFPLDMRLRSEQIVDSEGCYLDIRSNVEPNLFDDIPELASEHITASREARERLYAEGINKGKLAWSIACVPSLKAAKLLYPEAPDAEDAARAYWDAIFRMTMTDQPNCLELWEKLDEVLHKRTAMLNSLQIRTLQFSGPDTALTIGLSDQANWLGGSKKTSAGKSFTANVPSYEVFTTPDWRQTEGTVRITRPFNVAGVLVEGLCLEFRDGKISSISATKNQAAYEALVKKDPGACQLGEVALVGLDSPIYKEGRLFNNTLFDENAACHIATGNGYAAGIRNGWNMSRDELAALGRNESVTHDDVMISDPDVSVTATTWSGEEVLLIENGVWRT
jgi:aminopeptidase